METPHRLLLPLAALSLALLVAAVLVLLNSPSPTGGPPDRGPVTTGPVTAGPVTAGPATVVAAGRPMPGTVLRQWDRARERAWATADVPGLRALYVPGSVAGAVDVARLRAWRSRGLRVRGVRPQVLALEVRRATGSSIVLRVTERLVRAVAVGRGVRRVLPASGPATRTVTLQRAGRSAEADWRVVRAVRTARPPARRARRGPRRRSPSGGAPADGRGPSRAPRAPSHRRPPGPGAPGRARPPDGAPSPPVRQ
jgi:membrane-associated protease RseP (regulator of RpoE activity)